MMQKLSRSSSAAVSDFRYDQRVPEPLMVALSTIMMDELSDGPARRS